MKRLLYLVLIVVLGTSLKAQLIDGFDSAPADTNYWNILCDYAPQGDSLILTYITDPVKVGPGAMKVTYHTSGYESWGGFVGMEHWNPDTAACYDWSDYDSVSFWYYNELPAASNVPFILRFCLFDVSDSPLGNNTYRYIDGAEKYFSFLNIMKTAPGWNYVTLPLVNNDNLEGQGFALRTWGGGHLGNSTLDLDKIKGYVFELIVDGQNSNIARGNFIIDQLELKGLKDRSLVFFNGKRIPGDVTLYEGRSGSVKISDEESSNPATHQFSLKWTTPGQWDGPIWILNKTANITRTWDTDTLTFKIKAPAGIGDLKIALQDIDEDGAATEDYPFEATALLTADQMNYDGTWKTVKIALKDLNTSVGVWDDATSAQVPGEFDKTKMHRFYIFRTNDTRWANQIVYLDELWTGNPIFDVLPPEAPQGVLAVSGTYSNLVTWQDVPGEAGEVYDIYASTSPITDVTSPEVDRVAKKVLEGQQSVEHVIIAPGKDLPATYYYAVICTDKAGNESIIAQSGASVTNTAKGVPVIHPVAPASFAVDGEFNDWTGITPIHVAKSIGTGHETDGTGLFIDDDNDLSFKVYLAVDDNNLYVAGEIEDNVCAWDSTNDLLDSYLYDGVDLFLGLYDWRGERHTALVKGEETDYHFRFNKYGAILDQAGGGQIVEAGQADYFFAENFPTGWRFETKIPFSAIAGILGVPTFKPERGMRIPIDLIGNDNDNTAPGFTREGILTYSAESNDQSYRDVSVWTHTWIGEQWTVGVEDETFAEMEYKLDQNYPNPFNPSTKITFTLKQPGMVSLRVYNVLGQVVKTLVNEYRPAGTFSESFNASDLTSGMYIYELNTNQFSSSKKMLLVK